MKQANLEIIPTFPFKFDITRSNRKTLSIIIKSGKVEAKAPRYMHKVEIFDFIRQKQRWIEKHIAEQEVKLTQRLIIAHSYQVCFFGKPRRIKVVLSASKRPGVLISERLLTITTRSDEPAVLEKLFNKWLKGQASEYMTSQTIKYARRLGVERKLKKVIFRKTKSKWGHCQHDGTIQYNWLTMMAPKPVIDYLIAHETSHLVHMNHSDAFWKVVKRLCPAYADLKDWLSIYGHRLWTE